MNVVCIIPSRYASTRLPGKPLLDIAGNRARIGDASGLEDVDLSGLIADLAELYRDSADDAGFQLVTERV